MEKAKVYYTDFRTVAFGDGLPTKLKKLIKKAGIGQMDMDGKFVAIKMHFGELGNISFLRPNYARAVVDVVKELGGKPFLTAITDIANWIKEEGLEGYEKFPVSVEINPHLDDTEEMIAAAKKVSAISENFVIKIPCTEAGVAAARRLEKEGIRTNVTLVFSPAQAIWPAKNGSLFVSPFLGWKEANGEDCKQYIKDIVDIYKNYGFYGKTQIICAAIRTPKQIVDCAVAGADIVTTGLAVYQDAIKHAYTRQGIETFINAWDNTVTE